METVLVSSVVNPVHKAILIHERVLTADNNHFNVLSFFVGHFLAGASFGNDLAVAQLVSGG